MKSPILKRSIVLLGHKTSVSLEEPFWRSLIFKSQNHCGIKALMRRKCASQA